MEKGTVKLDMFLTFAKIGAFTFGGGYAMIPLIENECVVKKQWLSHDEFMDMTVIAEATPGPIAINCATYIGYKKFGIPGALLSTLGVVIPSFFIIFLISSFFEDLLQYEIIKKAFYGIRIAVAFLIMRAGFNMTRKMLSSPNKRIIKAAFIFVFFAFVLTINFLGVNFSTIYLMIIAGFAGAFVFHEKETKK